MRPWYNVDCLFYFSSQYEGYQKVVRGFDSFVTKILDHKKEQVGTPTSPRPRAWLQPPRRCPSATH